MEYECDYLSRYGIFKYNWEVSVSNYELRNANKLNIPRTKYVYFDDHPLFRFPRLWNDLNQELTESDSRSLFSGKIKEL